MKHSPDEKTAFILQQLEQGNTREKIAGSLHLQWKSVDMHMRRRGYRWDREKQKYSLQENHSHSAKIQTILQQLAAKNPNFKKIAAQHGFQTVEEMGHYMKEQGYIWHPQLHNYYYMATPENKAGHSPLTEASLMPFLLANQQALTNLLTQNSFSTHTIITKELSISLTDALYHALMKKCLDAQVTPQTVIELALKQYLAAEQPLPSGE